MFYRKGFALLLVVSLSAAAAWPAAPVSRARQDEDAPQQQRASRPRRAAQTVAPETGATPPRQERAQATPTPRPAPRQDETLQDEDDVERVEIDLTNVLFTAVDRQRRFVTTLRQEDIEVYEDNVRQEIFTFQRETDRPLSLAILIDTSNSQERTLPEEKAAARAFVDAVIRPAKDEVAVLSFTGDATLEQSLTGNPTTARRAIDRVEFTPPSGYVGGGVIVGGPGGRGTPPISGDNQRLAGSTAIWDAIWVTSEEVLRDSSDKTRRAIILLSDGVDTSSRMKMVEAIESAIKTDAIIYSIGIGDSFFGGVEEDSLRKLSERTGGRAFFPKSEEDLRSAFGQIQDELRSQYLVAYSPTKKVKDGSFRQVRIDVVNPELRKQNLRLTYRNGYFAQSASHAQPSGQKPLD
ncbi:MAG TPA: VWA domain-containing protein [Pyrinomonadaceae bacterium]|nr:VWA domain-containing protein [Pyrinomonadaceae bacterium]